MQEQPVASTGQDRVESQSSLFGGGMMSPVRDVHSVYSRLRQEKPVLQVNSDLGESWLVTRYADVSRILQDAETFSSSGNARGIGMIMGRTILEMGGSEHLRQRRLVTPAFSPRAIRERAKPAIETAVDALIDDFSNDGKADLVSQFTYTFPIRVIADLIGIPIEDFHQFHTWALQLISVYDDPTAAFDAAQKIVDHLKPIVEQRRREPREDLLSSLAHVEVEGEKLLEEEILSFLRLLLPAGAETTYRFTGTILYALLNHPEVLQDVRENPERLDAVLEETLRWESPVQYVSRETTCAVDLGGMRVPSGVLIMTAIGSANRDPARFADPETFDIDRKNVHEHLAFAFGAHYCLGTHLARREAHIAVSRLLEKLPNLRLDPDQGSEIVGVAFRSPDKLPVLFDC